MIDTGTGGYEADGPAFKVNSIDISNDEQSLEIPQATILDNGNIAVTWRHFDIGSWTKSKLKNPISRWRHCT